MQIKYLGHSAFEIKSKDHKILIDPFLLMCPNYKPINITDIFVTHGHADHLGSAIEISQKTNANITAIFELANYCSSKGANTIGINLGGWMNYKWGKVATVPAYHSSSSPEGIYTGCPCGFIFEIENKKIYHAGDTCLNSEMKLIGDFYKPDIAILPIGGHYTMDIEQALEAIKFLNADKIIPMHYNTFEAIKVDLSEFKNKVQNLGKEPIILEVNETYEFV